MLERAFWDSIVATLVRGDEVSADTAGTTDRARAGRTTLLALLSDGTSLHGELRHPPLTIAAIEAAIWKLAYIGQLITGLSEPRGLRSEKAIALYRQTWPEANDYAIDFPMWVWLQSYLSALIWNHPVDACAIADEVGEATYNAFVHSSSATSKAQCR